jgi:hypothetical protein
MRTIRYNEVLSGVAGLMGFPLKQLTEAEVGLWFEAINESARFAWEYFDWPDLVRLEESVANPETGLVIFELPGAQAPPKILAVYDRDPRSVRNPAAAALQWRVFDAQGVYLTPVGVEDVWVNFKLPFMDYRGLLHQAGVAYPVGSLVYARESEPGAGFERPGDWRRRRGGDPPADPSAWGVREFPYVLSAYVMRAAAAQLLESDGKPQMAQFWRRQAMEQLDIEVQRAVEMDPWAGEYLGPGGGVPRGPRGFRG